MSTFNEKFISLYNFKEAVNVNPEVPCKRYSANRPINILEQNLSSCLLMKSVNREPLLSLRYIPTEVDLYFEGTGYAKILIEKSSNVLILSQFVNTRSENALLLYIGNEVRRAHRFYYACVLMPSIANSADVPSAELLYLPFTQDSYYTVTAEGGYIIFRGREGDKVLEEIKSSGKLIPLVRDLFDDIISKQKTEPSSVHFSCS